MISKLKYLSKNVFVICFKYFSKVRNQSLSGHLTADISCHSAAASILNLSEKPNLINRIEEFKIEKNVSFSTIGAKSFPLNLFDFKGLISGLTGVMSRLFTRRNVLNIRLQGNSNLRKKVIHPKRWILY
jgi:hypothetical protein